MRKVRHTAAAMAAAACIATLPALSVAKPAANLADGKTAAARLQDLKLAVDSAREEQRRLEAKTAALDEVLRGARSEAAATAAAVAAGAADVARLERRLRRLAQREVALARALAARREQTPEALMALQRLARRPPAAELVHPDTTLDLSRAGAILKAAVEGISRRAEGLEQDLLDLGEAGKAIEARRHARDRAVARLRRESGRLDRLIAEKSALQAQLAIRAWDVAEHGRRLAAQAGEAEALVSRLRKKEGALAAAIAHHPPPGASMRPDLRRKPERNHKAARAERSRRAPGEPPAAGPGYPTDGRIVASFGKSSEGRGTSKGITWETASGARVVAPAPGVVAFAGPFRGYGLLLIVEHLDGYHSLLAGLAHIHVGIGQHVRSGDLLGAMGHRGAGNLSLYMELRKNGNPINPLPWLAAGKRKVSG